MNRKSKLFFSLISLCFSIAVLCFGVYSALSVSYSISGNVSYEIKDVFVKIDLSVYKSMSTVPIGSTENSTNASKIQSAEDITSLGFKKLDQFQDSISSYDPQTGEVESPGKDWTEPSYDGLNFTYGTPSAEDSNAYAFYIVLDITNYGSETINAQITAPSSLENTILRDSGNVEIVADGTERIVLGLALDDVTLGIDQANFSYTITINCGELPAEPITDMTFSLDEATKTATLTSYTGTDTMVEIPETIGKIKQTTKTFGPYADMTSLTDTSIGMPDAYLVGDISYTSGNEPKVDENQVIYFWMQDGSNASCTDITIECKNSYTLTMSASDMENEVGTVMLYGPTAGCFWAGDQTILDSMSMSYTIRLNNEEFDIDKNAIMQFIESGSGNFMDYINLIGSLIEGETQGITVTFEDIVYREVITSGTGYTITSITDGSASTDAINEIMPMFPSTVESISLPNTLTYIQYHAFEGTQWLENLRAQENYNGIVTSKDEGVKYYIETPGDEALTVEYVNDILQGVQVIGDMAFFARVLSGSIVIPNTVKSIGMGAFLLNAITSVTFEDGSQLESIGRAVFSGCFNLTSIEIPSSVKSIGDSAFNSCSNLTSIEIPSSVTSIGAMAFCDCSALKTVTFKDAGSVWVLDDPSNTEIKISEHTPQVLATYLRRDHYNDTWKKKQSA